MRTLIVLTLGSTLLLLPAAADDAAPDVVGAWVLITPVRGSDLESKMTLRRDAEGALAGTYVMSNGREVPLANLSFVTGKLRFVRTVGQRRIPFEAVVTGDRFIGDHRLGQGRAMTSWGARGATATAALRAERKQAHARERDIEADYDKHASRAVPRDGFPVLFDPKLTPAASAKGLRDDEPVIGIEIGGEARAYPVAIMGVHELVNDTCHGEPIAASW